MLVWMLLVVFGAVMGMAIGLVGPDAVIGVSVVLALIVVAEFIAYSCRGER